MSLHVNPTTAAAGALQAQKKKSAFSAAIISLLSLFLIGLILYVIALNIAVKKNPEIISYGGPPTEEVEEERAVTDEVQTKPTPPSSSAMAKVIASSTPSVTSIPTLDVDVPDPSLEFGNSNDFGNGWGNGAGSGSGNGAGWGNLPSSMAARCSPEERLKRLKASGGTAECEDAVVKALRWMKSTQSSNGSWAEKRNVGITGIALLAFLGHCETPNSSEFGDTVENAIVFLVNKGLANEGKLAEDYQDKHWPYEHAIATYALAEAYTLCKEFKIVIPNLEDVLVKAAAHIVKNQHESTFGWDYSYDTTGRRGGDSSLVCWHIQALKACKNTGISKFKRIGRPAKKALNYLQTCQGNNGAIYYHPSHINKEDVFPSMTGAAILCFQQWNRGKSGVASKAIRYAAKNVVFDYNTADSDLYAHYYYAQAFINVGGAKWDTYNKKFRDSLVSNQGSEGFWKVPGGGQTIKGTTTSAYTNENLSGRVYRTSLATLMLEVYYRYLPTK